jgi:hypothetical protein
MTMCFLAAMVGQRDRDAEFRRTGGIHDGLDFGQGGDELPVGGGDEPAVREGTPGGGGVVRADDLAGGDVRHLKGEEGALDGDIDDHGNPQAPHLDRRAQYLLAHLASTDEPHRDGAAGGIEFQQAFVDGVHECGGSEGRGRGGRFRSCSSR